MPKPEVAQKELYPVELEAGKRYAWCACGYSTNQPFCDGSHKGTGFSPEVFTAEDAKTTYLCGCKHTGSVPFCDGSHGALD
jgi:CDGSH-type Zn-finger protein